MLALRKLDNLEKLESICKYIYKLDVSKKFIFPESEIMSS